MLKNVFTLEMIGNTIKINSSKVDKILKKWYFLALKTTFFGGLVQILRGKREIPSAARVKFCKNSIFKP